MTLRLTRRPLLFALAGTAIPFATRADTWPSRYITMVLPSGAGSAIDATARRLAPMLAKALGQSIVIDNRPGAGGVIGTGQLVKSAPDGYTISIISSTFSASPSLYPITFDPRRDIQPVSIISGGPNLLVVNPANVPATTLKELLDFASKRPADKPLVFGNAGNGSTVQMAAAQLGIATQANISHIPYKAMNAYTTDLIGGVLDAGFLPPIVALPFIKDGRLRPIAVSTATRLPLMPNLPTVQESGVPGFHVDGWVALVVPAKVPRAIVERLNAEVTRAARDPDFSKFATDNGGTVVASSIEDAEKTIHRDLDDAARVIKRLGIRIE